MAATLLSEIATPVIQLLKQENGHSILLYEENRPAAAIISIEDYEIVRREKVARLI